MKGVTLIYFLTVVLMKILPVRVSDTGIDEHLKVFSNGTCIQNKWAPEITYAISGITDSRYQLTLIRDGKPVSMLMGTPLHSSIYFIDKVFAEIPCNWADNATATEVSDDFFDWYGSFQMYSAKMF